MVIAPNDTFNTIAVFTLIGAIAVVGWNIFSGYSGYISLGHSVFYGLGAYTFGLASVDWHIPGGWEPFLLLPLAGLVAGIVALPLGWISLRTRRHTFIVISIAWVFIFQLLAYNMRGITGGSNGVFMPLTPWIAPYVDLPFYYIAFAVLIVAVFVSWWIRHSKYGLGLLAIRDDEDRALGLGVKTGPIQAKRLCYFRCFRGYGWGHLCLLHWERLPRDRVQPCSRPHDGYHGLLRRYGHRSRPACWSAACYSVSAVAGSAIWRAGSEPHDLWRALPGDSFATSTRHCAIVAGAVADLEGNDAKQSWLTARALQTRRNPLFWQNGEGKDKRVSLLEVQAVSKAFGGIQALSSCSIAVEQGTISGLIGPNGSGKTTLFNVITGYEKVHVGTVLFHGQSITNCTPDRVFSLGIGRTFQLTRIFPRLTVLENMHIAARRERIKELFSRWSSTHEQQQALELLEFVNLLSHKETPAGNLSYGQKKLLEFALILVAKPQVILLDEPAGGVNPTMINELASHIRTLNQQQGITFLVVEHNMEFVMGLCDTVNVMHRGTKIAEGPPDQVRANPEVLEAYLGA